MLEDYDIDLYSYEDEDDEAYDLSSTPDSKLKH